MSPTVVALLFAVGSGTWAYSKGYRSTGGNNITAIVGGVVVGGGIFIIFYFLLNAILK